MRTLAPETFLKPYNVYVINKPIKVKGEELPQGLINQV